MLSACGEQILITLHLLRIYALVMVSMWPLTLGPGKYVCSYLMICFGDDCCGR